MAIYKYLDISTARMAENDILYENGPFWVCKSKKHEGYDVYKSEITHSVRCAQIGFEGQKGLDKAILYADKRAASNE